MLIDWINRCWLSVQTDPLWWRVFLSEITIVNASKKADSRLGGLDEKSKKSMVSEFHCCSEISSKWQLKFSKIKSVFRRVSETQKAETTSLDSTSKETLARDVLTLEAIYAGNSVDLRALDQPCHRAVPSLRPIFDTVRDRRITWCSVTLAPPPVKTDRAVRICEYKGLQWKSTLDWLI